MHHPLCVNGNACSTAGVSDCAQASSTLPCLMEGAVAYALPVLRCHSQPAAEQQAITR